MQIDYALIADHAEISGGKLYLMGGGWEVTRARTVPARVRMAVALGLRLEWMEAGQPIRVRVVLEDEDGGEIVRADGSLKVEAARHLPAGSSHLAQIVVSVTARFPRYGGYRVRITAGEGKAEVTRTLPFRVLEQA